MYVSVIGDSRAAVRGRRGDEAEGRDVLREGLHALGVAEAGPQRHLTGAAYVSVTGDCWTNATARWDGRTGYWEFQLDDIPF